MNGRDAFEEEMLFRTLSDEDAEQLLRGRAPEGSEFVEVAEFAQAVRQALPTRSRDGSALVRQLAEAARTAGRDGAAKTTPVAVPARARRFRLRFPRLVPVARVAAVLACVPMLFAGLAFAGVNLPEPARDAFDVVGVDLPNQPADDDGEEAGRSGGAGAKDESGAGDVPADSGQKAAKEKGQVANADKRGHGTEKANPARAGGRANGEQGRGRALGKRGLAPGQAVPPGQLKKGEGGKAVGKTNATPPGQSSKLSTGKSDGEPLGKGTAGSGANPEAVPKPAKSPKD